MITHPFLFSVTPQAIVPFNPPPQPQVSPGNGFITLVAIVVTVGVIPPNPSYNFILRKNGVVVDTHLAVLNVAGFNLETWFPNIPVASGDSFTVEVENATVNPEAVDWTDFSVEYIAQLEDAPTVPDRPSCLETGPCAGAYTRQQLLDMWSGIVDPSYSQQMLTLGEGEGSLEHITQALEQLATVSCAIERTTQAMYILPHSAMTGNPAQGEQKACVALSVERTKLPHLPLVLFEVAAQEVTTDAGEDSPLDVTTGRLYPFKSALVFLPGQVGPLYVKAEAEKPGYGYNYPLPGTLKSLYQPGSTFTNVNASVDGEGGSWFLKSANFPDVIIPEHVGQYVQLLSGPNVNQIYRIRGYLPPQPNATPPSGGTAILDVLCVMECLFGTQPVPGEMLIQEATGAKGIYLGGEVLPSGSLRAVISVRFGKFLLGPSPAFQILCVQSGTYLDPDSANPDVAMVMDQTPMKQIGGIAWKILDWTVDLGVTLSNDLSPSGGRLGFLDELGRDRGLPRSPGETDDSYRARVSTLADVVSPNAFRRTANRVLSPHGLSGCLREIGQLNFPGLYHDASEPGFVYAYDLDCAILTGILVGTFFDDEEVMLNGTPDLLPLGTYGLAQGVYAGYDPGTARLFVARKGLNPWTAAVGAFVVGKRSGATFQVTGIVKAEGRPQDRFKLWMDYLEFRAFFLMGVPPMDLGEFGFFYDTGPYGFFDSSPFLTFWDGFPATTAVLYQTIWNDLNKSKAGGVGFDLYQEKIGCI